MHPVAMPRTVWFAFNVRSVHVADIDVSRCSYWKKQLSLEDLLKVNDQTEKDAWQLQSKTGMRTRLLPCGSCV